MAAKIFRVPKEKDENQHEGNGRVEYKAVLQVGLSQQLAGRCILEVGAFAI